MNCNYKLESAKKIKIGIYGDDDESFKNYLCDFVMESIKPITGCSTKIVSHNNLSENVASNIIFCIVDIIDVVDAAETALGIIHVVAATNDDIIIIVDGCTNLEIDQDGCLYIADQNSNAKFETFKKALQQISNKNIKIFCASIYFATIWEKIGVDGKVGGLSEDQIDQVLTVLMGKKTATVKKLSLSDKKRDINAHIKNKSLDDLLFESGSVELSEFFVKALSLLSQKKIICKNYLNAVSRANVGLESNIIELVDEINSITFLKSEMYDELLENFNTTYETKIKKFCETAKHRIGSAQLNAQGYQKFLLEHINAAKEYSMETLHTLLTKELDTVQRIILDEYNKDINATTNLERIFIIVENFYNIDKNNVNKFLENIVKHPSISLENIENTNAWMKFIIGCEKLGISNDHIIYLLCEIIINKIKFYGQYSNSRATAQNITYPSCLNIFLLENLSKHFVLKKLHMINSYTIKLSGKNILEHFENMDEAKYVSLLVLEHKLLEVIRASA